MTTLVQPPVGPSSRPPVCPSVRPRPWTCTALPTARPLRWQIANRRTRRRRRRPRVHMYIYTSRPVAVTTPARLHQLRTPDISPDRRNGGTRRAREGWGREAGGGWGGRGAAGILMRLYLRAADKPSTKHKLRTYVRDGAPPACVRQRVNSPPGVKNRPDCCRPDLWITSLQRREMGVRGVAGRGAGLDRGGGRAYRGAGSARSSAVQPGTGGAGPKLAEQEQRGEHETETRYGTRSRYDVAVAHLAGKNRSARWLRGWMSGISVYHMYNCYVHRPWQAYK